MRHLLFDTSVLSKLFDKKPDLDERFLDYVDRHGKLTFSILTWYEIDRGLRAISKERQRRKLDQVRRESEVLPVSYEVLDRAAILYADLHKEGQTIGEIDLLIAATALTFDLGVATRDRDFGRIAGLHVEVWA